VAFELYTDVALTRDMPELGLRRGDVVKLVTIMLLPMVRRVTQSK
jgi:hypothetical protein